MANMNLVKVMFKRRLKKLPHSQIRICVGISLAQYKKIKTKHTAEHFDWVHSVERLIIAERLDSQRPMTLPPIQICIQVNIDDEASKSGVSIDQVQSLAEAVQKFSKLTLRGLMAIPQASSDTTQQRQRFARLRQLLEQLNQSGFNLDTLSMGMSG